MKPHPCREYGEGGRGSLDYRDVAQGESYVDMDRSADESREEQSAVNDSVDNRDGTESSSGAGTILRSAFRDVAPYLDLGWRLAGTAAFPPLIGFWVDVWLETAPWALLAGCALGLAASVLQLVRLQQTSGS